jgi:hypothetical protein
MPLSTVDPKGARTTRVTKNTVQYTDRRGRLVFAEPGAEIDILNDEVEHLEDYYALEPAGVSSEEVAERPAPNSVLGPVEPGTSDEEMINWVTAAKVKDVEDYLQSNPREYQRVLDAESIARGDKGPRPMVVKACELAAQTAGQ